MALRMHQVLCDDFCPNRAVNPSLFPPLMINLQSVLTREANVMSYY